jgi:hypothetical protein
MASSLTFASSTTDVTTARGLAPSFEFDEFRSLSTALVQRLREGSLPPNDAYWWTRALCAEAYLREDVADVADHCPRGLSCV